MNPAYFLTPLFPSIVIVSLVYKGCWPNLGPWMSRRATLQWIDQEPGRPGCTLVDSAHPRII